MKGTGGETIVVEGCRHCGTAMRDHYQLWIQDIGWHGWIEPTREQILERMRARLGVTKT